VEKKLPFKKAKPAAEDKPEGAPADAAESAGAESADAKAPAKGKAVKKVAGTKSSKGLASKARAKSTQQKSDAKKKQLAAVRPLRGGLQFICSECYEEFILPSTYERETVTCPECMHVGKRPAEDFIRTVNMHKSGERAALVQALGLASFLGILLLIFIVMITEYSAVLPATLTSSSTPRMVIGGLIAIEIIALVYLAVKYEKNRWEIYF
jgi:hypothetical protein